MPGLGGQEPRCGLTDVLRRLVVAACGVLLAITAHSAGTGSVAAQEFAPRGSQENLPALITADEVTYDEQLGVVTARGSVEMSQGDRVLRADVVSYNRRTSVVTASGNVNVVEPTGDVIFADYVELADELREGMIQNFRALLADQSRMAAVSARRSGGNTTIARRVVYSPCDLCKEDPTRAPVWQIKAARVTHDQAAQQVSYNDAWMEILGVPIAYTPYFSHPDGTVERKSGFLFPEFKSSSNLGQMVSVPYYLVIDNSRDATVEPIFLFQEAPVLAGEYREKTAKGRFQGSASFTRPDRRDDNNNRLSEKDTRGHIKVDGRFDVDDDWRWGFQGERATDDTYLQRYRLLQRYKFLSQNTLTSNIYTEGFRDRNYAAANAYAFQGLREQDDPGLSPIVLPALDYNYVGEPGDYGGRYSFDANVLSIYRNEGTRMQRSLVRGGWTLPWVSPIGEIYSMSLSLRGDMYNVSEIGSADDSFRPTEEGAQGRLAPNFYASWRYPFIRRDGDIRTIVEPIAGFSASPIYGSQSRFPNEDSRSVEFDETNLFRPNRFDGWDRLEGGQRVDYGVKLAVIRANNSRAGIFIGQSYRMQDEEAFPRNSGLEGHQSDYVGRVYFSPHPWLDTRYSFQADRDDLSSRRNRASASFGPSALRASVSYVYVDRDTQTGLVNNIEQIGTAISSRLTEKLRAEARYLTSLADDGGSLVWGTNLIYEDECLLLGVDMTRRYVGNRDIPPDTAIVMRVIFRNLGEIKSGIF